MSYLNISPNVVTLLLIIFSLPNLNLLALSTVENQKIAVSSDIEDANFGFSVAIDGNTAIVSSVNDEFSTNHSAGVVYIFVQDADGNWTRQAELSPTDNISNDFFGWSVAISGNTAIVGSKLNDDNDGDSGVAHVFTRDVDGNWTKEATLTADDGAAFDNFGISVAISGGTAVIGSYLDDSRGQNSGSAYVFTRSNGRWRQQQKLTALDGAADDYFGYSVALSGNTLLVGSFLDDDRGVQSGSAYVFSRVGSTWAHQAKLVASDGAAGDLFGRSTALSDGRAVIGSYGDDDNGSNSGSAYVFTYNGAGNWTEQAKLLADDGGSNNNFGKAVAIDESTIVVGSP